MALESIQQRFAAQARLAPDTVAVACGGNRLTFAELDRRANGLAHRLLELGVRPEEPVAVLMERSVDLAVAILGVLKAGGAYLPLHSGNPSERHRLTMGAAGVQVLLADEAMLARGLPSLDGLTVLDPAAAAAPADPDPGVASLADQLAYVIYTSGSTGTPKGVAVTHRDVLALVDDGLWEGDAHQRVLMLAPYAFDVSTYELWVPLLRGGQLVMAPPDIDVDTLRGLIRQEGITGLQLTAGLFRVVADEAPDCFAGVREVMTGGDVVSPTAVGRVLDACPGIVVRAMYGPTETTLFATHHPMTARPGGDVPLGRALDGMRVHVLDDELRPAPQGEAGELYIAGAGVARGYLGRADLTAERFVADPFGRPGTRMYRTGDLGRRNEQGDLEFLGRVGNQVKIRGFRVELGEVETALAAVAPDVQAVVVARGDEADDRRLVAYLVPEEGTPAPDQETILRRLAETLPAYMVPSAFVVLAGLPLTPNGKVDYRALPEPQRAEPDPGADVAPRDPREEVICRLFAQALAVPTVGVHTDFFEGGGTSLGATKLVGRIRAELGVRLTMRDLLKLRTPAGLAEAVHKAADAAGSDSAAGPNGAREPGAQESGARKPGGAHGDADGADDVLTPVLALRATGAGTPVFCVHPGGGMAWCYSALLRHLPKDVPVYGLQARGLAGTEPVARTMEEMVGDYLDQIRRIQPTGPYRLIGWSFGGNVAQSVAARLSEEGGRVELLAVLDSHHGGARTAPRSPSPREVQHLAFDGLDAFHAEPGDGPLSAARVQEILQEHGSPLAGVGPSVIEAITAVTANNIRVSDAARPARFDGDLLFFEATDQAGEPTGLAEVWRPYIGGAIERHVVGVGHLRLMTPAALDVVGPILARRLDPTA
ncbi:amino acid adenylation domain-containing protein [Streptacidiphilus anmyonensis]|uniref:amino acid adenylation domain-containing protein n=1 Tax=Streptacidiphilus anmyonensis TaxID=405782 RepID=UPI0007C69622|nr:amino acid adenylation domain-containing protein [Streptacidiphilus anmyonensis]